MTQWILTGPACVEWLGVNDFSHNEYHLRQGWPSTCWHVENKLPKMKYQSSLRRRVITEGSEKTAQVYRRIDCQIGVIKSYVSANK